ncbi:AAA domain-containing protein [Paraburkholderia bryophila]|uniref:AAA domain-containing protein n=1 Tax=Paraburkholderia bryophila TaxID=420952 RepID=UPI00234B5511|nr:AAA domain-containing protein [Paraburkholderia bryophila]WCM18176.1 AAA domain-containing protein [Paraburkholderia bryophila]
MVSIRVNGEDKTSLIKDWNMTWDAKREELMLTCFLLSGGSSTNPVSHCQIEPTEVVRDPLVSKMGGAVFTAVDRVVIYGRKYAAVQYRKDEKIYLMRTDRHAFSSRTAIKDGEIFDYFVAVAQARVKQANAQNRPIAENVLRQLTKLLPHEDTALQAYCTGRNQQRGPAGHFIYPFGINQSQLQAVERAFASQISLIEGPPGTGKTQTILNIVANIVLRGNSVAILSNNNAAVGNVYEKLGKAGLDYVVARLGNEKNRTDFFNAVPAVPTEAPAPAPSMDRIQAALQELKQYLHAHNEVARLQAEIDELTIEQRYLQQWQRDNEVAPLVSLDKYRLSPRKSSELMAYLAYLAENRIRLKDRIELLLNFRILRLRPFDDGEKRTSVIYALQVHFYEKALQDKQSALAGYQKALERGNFNTLLADLTNGSMAYLKQHLYQHIPRQEQFDSTSYIKKFDAFVKRFPIIGSGTHSIVNTLASDSILDYVIIDEASQQDIVPGILALGCARNLIIVGDRKQLPHIPVKLGIEAPTEFYDCDKHSLLDSCVAVFKDSIPVTLLKEHYRCHPRIIQFCNQQFYDNQLVPMTQDGGEQSLKLLVTGKGNHTRNNANLRELDSLLETLKSDGEIDWDSENSRGFIAPYNAQVGLSRTHLPADFVKETVHKFQGRECDEIVFSTVLDKKRRSQQSLSFVDDAHLVNVAVSRAKNRFTLVTGDDVFAANNGHIAALVRHIEYYADEAQIHRAPVVSAFDLLYKEYDQSLERLNARLRPDDSKFRSEQIVAQILREALSQEANRAVMFHTQIALNQLVSAANVALTAQEREYMKNRASCDFVLYFKVGKTPLGVIEVDGGYHDKPDQIARDALKNSILRKGNLPLLRLPTVASHIEEKVGAFLAQWASGTSIA